MNVYTLEDMNDLPEGTCIQDAKIKVINNIEYYEGTVSFRGCSFKTSVLASMCEEDNGLSGYDKMLAKAAKARGITFEEAQLILDTAKKNRGK